MNCKWNGRNRSDGERKSRMRSKENEMVGSVVREKGK